jgi:heptaprenyl diphosphate synthase
MIKTAADSPMLSVHEAQQQAADVVRQALMSAPNPVCEITSHLAGAQGKGIRTLLLLYISMDSDGLVHCDAVKAAAAVELFHLATLVHDDVIDNAPLRRGIPTVQHKFGRKHAVICGDYLLCLAASLAVPLHTDYQEHTGLLSVFTSALSRICMGELRQLHNNRNIELGIPGYLRIIGGKTAALFYVAAFSGAIIARYNRDEAMRLARFGRYFGMVFQIVDDCKDYEISEDEALKTVGKDICEGVVTLPLIYAFRSSPQLRDLAKGAFDDAVLAKQLAKAVCDVKGTQKSRDLAVRYANKARLLLKAFPDNKARSLLELLSKSIGVAGIFNETLAVPTLETV